MDRLAATRMTNTPIDQDSVRSVVESHGLDWRYQEQTGSTNSDALEFFSQNQCELVVFAETQSAGRGRRGRQWLSPYAQNIYCTLGLVKSMPVAQQGLLSIVTGLALSRSLESSCGLSPQLKWPNDLLVDGRKLGGILIESRPKQSVNEQFYAIGFGLNVFLDEDVINAIEQPATSLHLLTEQLPDRSQVLVAAIDEVVCAIRTFDVSDVGRLTCEFSRFDVFHDRPVELVTTHDCIAGINRGIEQSGASRLETQSGIESYPAAEISLVSR